MARPLGLLFTCCCLLAFAPFFANAFSLLTPYALAKTLANAGDPSMFIHVNQKLLNGECLNITSVGGSMTEAPYLPPPFFMTSWVHYVVDLLNTKYPCKTNRGLPSKHKLNNVAKNAMTSTGWVEKFVGQQEMYFGGVDLVIIDTACNDMGGDASQADNEILMAMALQQSKRYSPSPIPAHCTNTTRAWTGTAVIYVGVSTAICTVCPLWKNATVVRKSDKLYAQIPVAFHHGVPVVSAVDAIGPFLTNKTLDWMFRNFYHERGPELWLHPTPFAQKLVGDIVFNFINSFHEHYIVATSPAFDVWSDLQPYCPQRPAFNDEKTLDTYLDNNFLRFGLTDQLWTPWAQAHVYNWTRPWGCNGFVTKADRPGKPGLIGSQVNATCTFIVYPNETSALKEGKLHITALKSYDQMGVAGVTVLAGDPDDNGNCNSVAQYQKATALASGSMDCLWTHHASEPDTLELDFTVPAKPFCLYTTLTNLGSPDGRTTNKLKFISLIWF